MNATYAVRRVRHGGGEAIVARHLETVAEAVEIVWRLTALQETEGGQDEFCLCPE